MNKYKILNKFLFTLYLGLLVTGSIIHACATNSDIEKNKPNAWPSQVVRWAKDGKTLIFVACHHTNNLSSPIHRTIKNIFDEEKPDIYLMEGFSSESEGISPDRIKEKAKQIIESTKKCADNLYAAYLATENGVPFIGADLADAKQITPLKERGYSLEDVIFYLLVQQLPYFYRDGDFETHTQKFTPENWEPMCNAFLHKNVAGWIGEDVSLTYKDFLAWWERNFKTTLDMEKEFSDWKRGNSYTSPNNDREALYSQRIAYWWHKNRDDHIFSVLKDQFSKNTTTLIVFGATHLQNMWDRLTNEFGEPQSIVMI